MTIVTQLQLRKVRIIRDRNKRGDGRNWLKGQVKQAMLGRWGGIA